MKLLEIDSGAGKNECVSLLFDDDVKLNSFTKIAVEFNLYPGKEVDESTFLELERASAKEGVRMKAAQAVSRRAMSVGELVRKLVEKGEPQELAEEAAEWLVEIGALDDEAYARTLVSHCAAKGYGSGRIKQEFYRRHIPRDLWEEALETLNGQEERIDRFIVRKLGGQCPDRKEQRKIADALFRRGYSWDEIGGAMKRYMESVEGSEDCQDYD